MIPNEIPPTFDGARKKRYIEQNRNERAAILRRLLHCGVMELTEK
jgi:hypothetical protein